SDRHTEGINYLECRVIGLDCTNGYVALSDVNATADQTGQIVRTLGNVEVRAKDGATPGYLRSYSANQEMRKWCHWAVLGSERKLRPEAVAQVVDVPLDHSARGIECFVVTT